MTESVPLGDALPVDPIEPLALLQFWQALNPFRWILLQQLQDQVLHFVGEIGFKDWRLAPDAFLHLRSIL